MIVHLFPREKFTSNFINLVNANFPREAHTFIVYEAGNAMPLAVDYAGNVAEVESLFRLPPHLRRALKSCDKVIAHSLSGPVVQYLAVHPGLWHKLYVLFWGYEIYILGRKQKGLRNALYQKLIALLARRARGVITLLEKEKASLDSVVKVRGRHFAAPYTAPGETERRDAARVANKPADPYWFILGNNSNDSGNHIEAMERLAAYAGKPFKVLVPLSYGSADNRDAVLREGPRILGEAFVPLTEFLDWDAYYALLGKCAVGLFNNDRQQAMGNINALGYMGAKVYLRRGTPMWETFVEDRGYRFFDIEEVGRLPFEELVRIAPEDVEVNRAEIARRADPAVMVAKWRVVFEDA